jgi:lipopolysaccharide/colanic/teichoic acid biosynthesis glycosyltransferase
MYLRFGKRIFDIIAASLGLIVCLPLFGLVGILVKASSPGPIFFKQERLGQYCKLFKLIKFRTMHVDEVSYQKQFTPGDENRITWIGKFLRKTKLDELPELVNVLLGHMSLVGPRPEVPKYLDWYGERFSRILQIKPGITDYATIKYRNEENILFECVDPELAYLKKILPDKLELNQKYVENMSFFVDLKILFLTLFRVFFKE